MQGSAPLCKCGRSAAWRTALAATPAKLSHVCAVKRARLATHCAASASRSPVVNAASVAAGWGPESWHSQAPDVCGALPGVQEWSLVLLCVCPGNSQAHSGSCRCECAGPGGAPGLASVLGSHEQQSSLPLCSSRQCPRTTSRLRAELWYLLAWAVVRMLSAPCLVDGREWNQAYAQLEMERGFCSLGGAEKYSPELVQRTAMESPGAAGRVVARGAEMLWRVGVFAFSLLADNASGRSEELGRVRLRAQQLRCAGLGFPARRSVRAAVVHSQAGCVSGIPGVSRDVWNSMRRGECGAPAQARGDCPPALLPVLPGCGVPGADANRLRLCPPGQSRASQRQASAAGAATPGQSRSHQAGPGPKLSAAVAGGARAMLTALGPSFIKAGQVLASRPDIVREDYMNELCTLQDDVPCFPDAEARCCGGATGAARCWLDAPGGRVGRGGPSCRKRL